MDRRKGRVSTPLEVDQLVRSIKESLDRLTLGKYSYREAHTHVHTDRRDSRTDENQGVRISNSHVSDPTAEIVESQAWNRSRLVHVAKSLEAAARDIDSAVASTRDVFSHEDDYYHQLEGYRS